MNKKLEVDINKAKNLFRKANIAEIGGPWGDRSKVFKDLPRKRD